MLAGTRRLLTFIVTALAVLSVSSVLSPRLARGLDNNILQLLYVDSPVIETGNIESIVAVVSEDCGPVASAEMSVKNLQSGQDLSIEASRTQNDSVLFEIPCTSSMGLGSFQILSFRFSFNDGVAKEVTLPKNSNGVFSIIGSGGRVNALARTDVEELTEQSVSPAFYGADSDGGIVSATSIEDVVDEGQQDISLFSMNGIVSLANSVNGAGPIALDPGHGGYDVGAVGGGLYEADINWKIAIACKNKLESLGVSVVLTRGQNECPTIQERVDRAVNAGARAIVSIHINSGSSVAYGCEVWVPNTSSWYNDLHNQGVDFAQLVLAKLESLGLYNRGWKIRDYPSDGSSQSHYQDGSVADYYGIIRYARQNGMLGVIIEHAFISNATDAWKLADDSFLNRCGEADAAAIFEYFGKSWDIQGVDCPDDVAVNQSVRVAPIMSGESDDVRYNYVWSRNGSWQEGEWDSTFNSTGSYTDQEYWDFIPDRPGVYSLAIDAVQLNSDGSVRYKKTVTKDITVAPVVLSGIEVADAGVVGDAITIEANVSGLSDEQVDFEYSWHLVNNQSISGTSGHTSAASYSFVPSTGGEYLIEVKMSAGGGYTKTASATVSVASIAVDGVDAPAEASTGEEVRYSADARGDL
ncbi:N-acetylmuramoyl-L-alanine amidase family protein, partial [Collinsella intestinalis]|uniref:N-acetylmuramoyl-L-alanine amidase family protein n=1 Tax=Collinsella intestinalis TaxID=147207 RepID=UPI00195C0E71